MKRGLPQANRLVILYKKKGEDDLFYLLQQNINVELYIIKMLKIFLL